MSDLHTGHKGHNKADITQVGPVWQTPHMNTSLFYAILINACTHSSIKKIHGSPKMNSTSHTEFKFFRATSLLELSTCILIIKGWYFAKTCFVKESI